jgi:hypothetical protein
MSQENVELVRRRIIAAFNHRDVEARLEDLDPEVSYAW